MIIKSTLLVSLTENVILLWKNKFALKPNTIMKTLACKSFCPLFQPFVQSTIRRYFNSRTRHVYAVWSCQNIVSYTAVI